MSALDALLRVTAAFVGLLFWSRMIGKKMISHMTFFDFVAMVTFGSIGGNIIFNRQVPLWDGLLSLSAFSLFVLLADYISMKSQRGQHWLEGRAKLIIHNGRIQMKALKSVRLTVDNLLMLLRKKDVFYLDEVETAYFETDGTVTILKKPPIMPVNRKDMKLEAISRGLPHICVMDGNLLNDNLAQAGKSREWMLNHLREQSVRLEDVLIAQVDQQENVHIEMKSSG